MNGLVQVDFTQVADIYIINTCTVTNTADAKSRNIINRAKKTNPKAIIIAAGCYIQTANDTEINKLGIDIIIGNKYKSDIYDLIHEFVNNNKPINKKENLMLEKKFEETSSSSFENRTRAFIKIQDGCNFMCSYCTIPFARGRQRSSNYQNIINQIIEFVKRGFKEIVLTGVNTAGYQYDDIDFLGLLKKINDIPGKFRIRISSVEPFQISDEIIELIMTNPNRFCNHWHLCLQSGDDQILQAMNRKYTTSQFKILLDKIRSYNEDCFISTDLIVGFPTETLTAHNNSMRFIVNAPINYCHIFTYSKRKQTAASKLLDINGKIKHQRFLEADKLNKINFKNYLNRLIGKELEVIFETYQNGIYEGKSSEYAKVLLKSDETNLLNEFVKVKVVKQINFALIVELKK